MKTIRSHNAISRAGSVAPVPASHGFTLLEIMVSLAIIAILAVVAVPQFTHHMRMARTTEATMMLDVIKKGATAYYASPRTTADGSRLACQFPASIGVTPIAKSCCDAAVDKDLDGRCDVDPRAFDKPVWESMHFGLSSQHMFQYSFESSGTLSAANAVMSAFGDQDCDGVISTFHLVIDGDPAATMSGCDATVAVGYFYELETE